MKERLRVKDNVITYFVMFISIFSFLSLVYICSTDDTNKINECLKTHDLDYCNEVVI